MGFSIRFGGWRPVQLEEGQGSLHLPDGAVLADVGYRFEVWHQMVGGFPGPFRSEGRLSLDERAKRNLESLHGEGPLHGENPCPGEGAVLELADGRRLPVRLGADGSLLAHARPAEAGRTIR
jgi:hypothetical protein